MSSKHSLISRVMSLSSTSLKNAKLSPDLSNNESSAYETMDKQDLIQKIYQLESKLKAKESTTPKQILRSRSTMNFDDFSVRRIALKVSYIGIEYLGFSSFNKAEDFTFENRDLFQTKSIEDYLYRALLTCRLVKDRAWSEYSLCGRTDKGVSGTGQVISIKVRSNLPKEEVEKDYRLTESTDVKEFNFCEMINKLLPVNINVTSWAPVTMQFNARFDCSARHYKYFFLKENLDISRMKLACEKLVGDHDFRNLCKQDTSKDIATYVRTMKEVYIEPCIKNSQNGNDWYELNIVGNSFLWHQVRCIMGILFLVGNKQEEPEIFDVLFGPYFRGKPTYEIASPYPLVLYKAYYHNIEINWQMSSQGSSFYKMHKLLYENCVRTFLMTNNLETLLEHKIPETIAHNQLIILGAGTNKKCNKYKPIKERNQLEPPEKRREKYITKKAKLI